MRDPTRSASPLPNEIPLHTIEPHEVFLLSAEGNPRTRAPSFERQSLIPLPTVPPLFFFSTARKKGKRTKNNFLLLIRARRANNDSCGEVENAMNPFSCSSLHFRSIYRGRKNHLVSASLPENSPSIILAAMAVGAAATLLARRTTSQITNDISTKTCEECGGSGVCSWCNGEGFILKKLSAESADKARMASKNMATRYTAGLPKKWSYCTKCSSSRSCPTCEGTGSVSS